MAEKGSELPQVSCPPAYALPSIEPRSNGSSRKSKAVLGYAIGVTVALVILVILGSVYYYKSLDVIQSSVVKFQETYKTPDKKDDITQETEVDQDNNVAVFRLTGKGIPDGTIAVLDYTRSMTGLYDPEVKQCFLLGGIRKDIVDPKTLSQHLYGNKTKEDATVTETLNFQKADDYPITDKSILPKPLQASCKHLPTYWMEPATEKPDQKSLEPMPTNPEEGSGRQKRACYYYYRYICYRIGSYYYCYWYLQYRCY